MALSISCQRLLVPVGAAGTMGKLQAQQASLSWGRAMLGSEHLGHCHVPSTVTMGIQGLLNRNGAVGDLSLQWAMMYSGQPHLGAVTAGWKESISFCT